MKLLSVKQARAIWLFSMADINPSGKYLIPLIGELVKRYNFLNTPNVQESIKNGQGLLFGSGVFSHSRLGEITVDLGIYNDGLVGDTCADTAASEDFLMDLLKWVKKGSGFKYPKNIRKRYSTELFVETDRPFDSINTKLEKLAKLISTKSNKSNDGDKSEYQLGGIFFASEQHEASIPPLFRFERAVKVPYSENRYYSSSGLRLEDHLEVLNELEKILTRGFA